MDDGLKQYPDIVKKYFATVIPTADNKFSALNSAVWSGGSFIYVPKGVSVPIPLQAYFRINSENMGQFERTLIIADEGSFVHYIEGCLPEGELISLGDTFAAIETVRPGQKVMNSAGLLADVSATRRRDFRGTLIRVIPVSVGNAFELTPDHPVLAFRRENISRRRSNRPPSQWDVQVEKMLDLEAEWVPAGQLKAGDILCFPIASQQKDRPELSDDLLRFLGYYLAEGSAFLNGVNGVPTVSLSFNMKERSFIQEALALMSRLSGKSAREYQVPSKNESRIYVYSRNLMEICWKYCGRHSAHKALHRDLMDLPPARQRLLVETYLNGDGSRHRRKNGRVLVRAVTTSRALAFQLQEILSRMGIYAGIQVRAAYRETMASGRAINHSEAYFVHFEEGKTVNQVWKDDRRNCFWVPVRRIASRLYDGPVYNVEMARSPNAYLARGFAVHNCTAPTYSSDSLHSAVVELIALPGAKIRYTTIQNWSKNVFNLVTKRALAHTNATVEWIDGNLGCLAEGSTVTTPDGIKPIESVEVGESVLSYDEPSGSLVFRRVTAKKQTGQSPVRKVSAGSRALWVTDNHPFFSFHYDPRAPKRNGRYRFGYIRADQLTEAIVPRTSLDFGQPYTLQRPDLETRFLSKNQYSQSFQASRSRESRLLNLNQTTNDILWLFGYWVGDGNIETKSGKTEGVVRYAKVGFSTPRADRARTRLVQTMGTLLESPFVERRDGNHVYWSDTELAHIFHINGFTGNARTKRVPVWVWSLPQSQRLSFIAGYLDADGTVISNKRVFSIKSVNRPLLEDVSSLLLTLGIPSRLYTEFDQPRSVTILGVDCVAHGSHRLEFPLDERLFPCVSAPMRSKAMGAPVTVLKHHRRLGRSQLVLPETMEVVDVSVSAPTQESVPVWDIEVEGTGNFVSQGFVVHNSQLTMKYPAIYLMGEGARGEVLSVAFSGKDQHQDAGSKIVHAAPNTTSVVTSKSISKDGGRSSYRGLVKVARGATGCKSNVRCDALILDDQSRSDTYPTIEIDEEDVTMGHEATVSKIGEEQLFYLQSRGLSEHEATLMIVNGFFEPFTKELPMEYAVELNRLLEMEMEGSVG
jgi:Fe-S cluster assembly scaffold protein SufB